MTRRQFPLQLDVGDTIHAYQGATLEGSVTLLGQRENGYNLWNKEQLISLLGRTRFAKNTCFGSPFGSALDIPDIYAVSRQDLTLNMA